MQQEQDHCVKISPHFKIISITGYEPEKSELYIFPIQTEDLYQSLYTRSRSRPVFAEMQKIFENIGLKMWSPPPTHLTPYYYLYSDT